jgi:hypothetical protein
MEEERRRPAFGHFNILHHATALRADIYLEGDDPLHAWALSARQLVSMEEGSVWFAPVEYVIVRKLEYLRDAGSDRHLHDIAGIVRVSGPTIEFTVGAPIPPSASSQVRDDTLGWGRDLPGPSPHAHPDHSMG